jgi:hypothetical protein
VETPQHDSIFTPQQVPFPLSQQPALVALVHAALQLSLQVPLHDSPIAFLSVDFPAFTFLSLSTATTFAAVSLCMVKAGAT